MDTASKLEVLGESSKYDKSCSTTACKIPKSHARPFPSAHAGIYYSKLSDGKTCPLLKVLMTNECKNDCKYCVNRHGRDCERVTFEPAELASLFMSYHRKRYVEGIFLSSGISSDSDRSMEKMLETLRLLRGKYNFRGYVHCKILPGASYEYVKQAAEVANRISINLEAPSRMRLNELTSQKEYKSDLLRRLGWMASLNRKGLLPSGHTTQFIVGAAGERDVETLGMSDWLYKKMSLKRSFFSAFQPVAKTPLETLERVSIIREHRLYQADFLMRLYGVKFKELIFDENENLPLRVDPKMMIALKNREMFPVDVNSANYEDLLRVPGIGPKSARKITEFRETHSRIRFRDLKGMGIITRKSTPFMEIEGSKQTSMEDFCKVRGIPC